MNKSSHTGQKNEKQADAAAVVLQWENVIFTPSYLTFTFRSSWIFLFYWFFFSAHVQSQTSLMWCRAVLLE